MTGVQRYAQEIVACMKGQVRLIAPRENGVGIAGHLWEQAMLPWLLRDREVLWSPCNTGPLAVRRHVVTIHDTTPWDHPEWLNPNFARWYRWLIPKLARRARRIFADSQFSKERIVVNVGIPAERIVVVYPAAGKQFKARSTQEVAQTIMTLGLPSPHYLLSLCSLEPRKNLIRLLAAWERVLPELPQEVWLVLSGALGVRRVFGQISLDRIPPRVHLTGYVEEAKLPALYTGALGFAYVSLFEGFGLPPLEAMACGTPVLTSRFASLPEVVGEAAFYLDPTSSEEIAEGIRQFVDDSGLRQQLRQKGLERVTCFSWEKSAAQVLHVLAQVAAEKD